MAELTVYYESRTVGTIEVHAEGPAFTYAPEWLRTRGAFPLSLLMPLSPRRVPPRIFLPWAANLLPEASQLKAIGLQLGAAPEDVIGILAELGRDTAGALSIGKPGSTSPADWRPCRAPRRWSASSRSCRRSRSSSARTACRCRSPACRSKIGVAINAKGQICIPINGSPSTYILKPDSERLYGSVQNEALCLALARRLSSTFPTSRPAPRANAPTCS